MTTTAKVVVVARGRDKKDVVSQCSIEDATKRIRAALVGYEVIWIHAEEVTVYLKREIVR